VSVKSMSLGELCTFVTGGTPSRKIDRYFQGDTPWITGADMDGSTVSTARLYITEEAIEHSATSVMPKGSILLVTRTGVGKVAIAGTDICISQDFTGLLPDEDRVDTRYLFHFLQVSKPYFVRHQRGATIQGVTRKVVFDLKIPLPPLAEQQRIAAILDQADAVRQKRQQAIALTDELPQATFLDMFGDPVTNPKGWDRRKLGEIINFKGGSQPQKSTFTHEPSKETVRLVQIRDFKSDRYRTFIPKALARRQFDEDDVMIARYGPPVFQILTGLSGSYNVALMKAEPIGAIEKRFIFHLLNHPAVNSAVVAQSQRTAGQSGVNLKFLNNYPAYLPPLDLQHRFAQIVEATERKEVRQHADLAELDTLFNALVQRAFRGDL